MKRLLIANRGEIALRIARTARRMGIAVVAVYSDADANAPHVRTADAAFRIGASPAAASYLDIDAVMAAAHASNADAVHPGYGFLAERPEFAERCEAEGLTFVGPSAASMLALGNKSRAKRLLEDRDVPFLPGYHGEDQSDEVLVAAAHAIGMPLMIKASSGGGGRGMRLVLDERDLPAALRSARSEALAAFGDGDLLLERALLAPRHVEVQIFGDAFGNVVHLSERDCSVQRRHQKLIEETPSPAVDAPLRERLGATAIAIARAAAYRNAGTVEFLLDRDGSFYFIEMNARLQVEHTVTEAVTGFDLVEWQLRIARGEALPVVQQSIVPRGHAIEARLCAEDPARDYLPQTGTLVAWRPPPQLRVEHALEAGAEISPYYDSMIAKIVAYGRTREDARRQLVAGLASCVAFGVPTNAAALALILDDDVFAAGAATTRFIEERLAAVDFARSPPREVVALAAALTFHADAEHGAFGNWTSWTSSELAPATIRLRAANDCVYDARVLATAAAPAHVTIADVAVAVELDVGVAGDATAVRYRCDRGPWLRGTYCRVGSTTYLACGGSSYSFEEIVERSERRGSGAVHDGLLRAPMSGRVVAVVARSGVRADAGATLVVLEAMKMEHTLTLPMAATIGEVTADEGAQVHANDVLLAYEA